MIEVPEQTRRDFLRLCGLGFAAGAASAITHPIGLVDKFVARVRGRIGVTNLDGCIEPFFEAATGELMHYYQKFFPVYVEGVSADSILSFAKRCELRAKVEHENNRGGQWHRIHVLPAVAAAHCLISVPEEEQDDLRQLIRRVIKGSVSPNSELPNREIVIIPWQNLLSALIGSDHAWRQLRVGGDVVREAAETCLWFLSDRRETLPLVDAACIAWQFLLTYEIALKSREQTDSTLEELREVQSAKSSVVQRKSAKRYIWLATLAGFYRNYQERVNMPPQGTELMVCNRTLAYDPQLLDFFVMVRIEANYSDYIMATRNPSDAQAIPLVYRSRERVEEVTSWAKTTLKNFGYTPEDWQRLQPGTVQFLSDGAAEFARDMLFGKGGKDSEFQLQESDSAVSIQELIIRTRLEEGEAANQVIGKKPEELGKAIEVYLDRSVDIAPALGILLKPSFDAGKAETAASEGKVTDVVQTSTIASDSAPDVVKDINQKAGLNGHAIGRVRFADPGRQLVALLKTQPSRTISVGIDFAEINTNNKIPVEVSLPGQGEDDPVGERSKLKQPSQQNQMYQVETEQVAQVMPPFVGNMVPFFGPPYKRVRFVTEEADKLGFRILRRSGYPVKFLRGGLYGLSSKEQVKLLDDHQVRYQTVD